MTTRLVRALLSLLWLMPLLAQSRDVRRIQDRFVAPCCWQESVAIHRSEVAAEMRAEIASMVAAGHTENQVIEIYVGRYGERILQEPRGVQLVWLSSTPLAVIGIAAAWLLVYVWRQRQAQEAMPAASQPTMPERGLR